MNRSPPWLKPFTLGAALALFGLAAAEAQEGGRDARGLEIGIVQVGVNVQQPPRLELATAAGFGWVRMSFRWDQIEPARGAWDFSAADREVGEAEARGLRVLGILARPPEWAGGGPLGNRAPADLQAWAEYVGRTVRRYRGRVAAWEVWNEPNLGDVGVGGVGLARSDLSRLLGLGTTWTDLLVVASAQIRAADPRAAVVGPALSSRPSWRSRWLLRGLGRLEVERDGERALTARDLLDAVSFHANVLGDAPPRVAAQRLAEHLADLEDHAPELTGKPVWITELGWRSSQVGEEAQARYLCEMLRLLGDQQTGSAAPDDARRLTRAPVTHVFVYKLVDLAKGADPQESTSGVFRRDGLPKAAVEACLGELRDRS